MVVPVIKLQSAGKVFLDRAAAGQPAMVPAEMAAS